MAVALVAVAVLAGVVISRHRGSAYPDAAATGPAAISELATGDELDRPVPPMSLIDAQGRRTSLAAYRGRYVILAPTMTLCHEVCPMTTGALTRIQQTIDARGLARKVAVVEVTVDPWRDSPARLRAFKRMTGVPFQLLTGTKAEIHRLWKFFGIYYRRVPQGTPPDVDWWTHRPERFDVQHSDALLYLDPRGYERIATLGMPDVGGRLAPSLRRLLNDQGRHNLEHPDTAWTVPQAVQNLWHLMGRPARGQDTGTTAASAPNPAAARAALAGSPPALAGLHAQAGRLLAGGKRAFDARLAALRGHPVVVNGWASWCPPCRQELALFQSASLRTGNRVAFLGLDVNDSAGSARAFMSTHPVSYPSYQDSGGGIARSLAAFRGLPTTMFLGSTGKVVYTHIGAYTNQTTLDADIDHYALGR